MNIISKTFFFIRCKSHLTTVAFRFCVIFPLYSFFSHQYTGILRESELFSIVDILERCIVSAFSILSNCLKQYSVASVCKRVRLKMQQSLVFDFLPVQRARNQRWTPLFFPASHVSKHQCHYLLLNKLESVFVSRNSMNSLLQLLFA